MKRILAAVLLALVMAAPVSAAVIWGNATTNGTVESRLKALINAEHLRVCGTPLVDNSRLVWMARYRATDMVLNGYFAHLNPVTGKRVWDLMAKAGIGYTSAAEILSWNSYPDDLTADMAYQAFMGSTSHRAAIRSCTYTHYGVGDYKAGSRRMFAVLFIRP